MNGSTAGRSLQVISFDGVHNPTLGEPFQQWAATAATHYTQKTEEIRQIQQQVQQTDQPFLLLCDCNLVDTSEAYRQLSDFAHDSFRERGWGLGHTLPVTIGGVSIAAGQRLDYIWHSSDLTVLSAHVVHNAGSSDHFPVVAEVAL